MKKITNSTHLEGYLFSHDLALKVSGENAKTPGVEFIAGTLEIATDDEGMNVVPVTFRYVTAKFASGKANATFSTLKNIIEKSQGNTWTDAGKSAWKIKVDTALGINDFYNAEGELITYKLNDGGFVHVVNAFGDDRNSFTADVVITGVNMKDADEEAGTPEIMVLKANTFNFRNDILPVDLVVKNSAGMGYFEGLEASAANPIFLKVWGVIECSTISRQIVEESAFGNDSVKTTSRKLREWVVTGASTEPYDFGDETVLTKDDLTKAAEAREVYLADVKQRRDEYLANKGTAPAAGAPAKAADFSF